MESAIGDCAATHSIAIRTPGSTRAGGGFVWPRRSRDERPCATDATAYRLVHGEADGCPSLVCDRYDQWLVVQLLSAGLDACRADIVRALSEVARPEGIPGPP